MAAASLIRGGEIPIEVSYQEVRGVDTKYVGQLIGFLVNTAAGTTKELGLLRARLELFFTSLEWWLRHTACHPPSLSRCRLRLPGRKR